MTVLISVSASEEEAARLERNGPRRDFKELARATGGRLVYRPAGRGRSGWRGKLAGPHLRQAWEMARRARPGDTLFADGEHVGIPLAVFLGLRRRRGVRLLMLGHFVSRGWKRALLGVATRCFGRGTLILHSVRQQEAVRHWLGRRWETTLVPYQVDTEFWSVPLQPEASTAPLVLAVGSENRDYDTLATAAAGLPLRVRIAAGSHWARTRAGLTEQPANVDYIADTLDFAQLREQYRQASAVVVPLHPVENQSGVTVILEAMSMGLPVVTTASPGQRECLQGPLVLTDGSLDVAATADRGPQAIGGVRAAGWTGLYVPPGDPPALRHALERLSSNADLAAELGRNGRCSAAANFTIDGYIEALASLLVRRRAAGREDRAVSNG